MLRLTTGLAIALAVSACGKSTPDDPDTELDLLTEFVPGTTGVEADDASTGTVPVSWGGPDIEPVADRVWGGLGVVITDLDCTLWWELQGESVPCGDCTFGFELQAFLLDDTCGLGASDIAFQLEVNGGNVYGFYNYWGLATYGGGVLTWDGLSDSYYGYRYYGFLDYLY